MSALSVVLCGGLLSNYIRDKNADVPIRNDHDLNYEIDGKAASRAWRVTVDLAPTGENADRYSVLLRSWSKSVVYCRALEVAFHDEESEDDTSEHTGMPPGSERILYCKLCEKLDVFFSETRYSGLRRHMRAR